jgi:predicted DCC family thiol-disulfide oxidoreductase YuxK
MLAEKVILYDDSCPLCQLYTEGFVRLGVLPRAGRVAFGQAPAQCPEVFERLDVARGRVAIPLIDRATGEIVYGLDALFLLIGHRAPWLRPLLRQGWLKAAIWPLYRLLSYNRRQIAGCKPPTTHFDCRPEWHLGWRSAWLGIALTGWLASVATHALAPVLVVAALQLVGGIFVARRGWDALGSFATNCLVFGILLALLPWWPLALAITLLDLYRRAWVFRL